VIKRRGRLPLPSFGEAASYHKMSVAYLMENDLHEFTFTRADWMRIEQALRAQARDCYNKMTALGENGKYYEILWQEYGHSNALADDIQWKIGND
jgi:hypothetical protein